jgi:hypothetical protein
MNNEQANSKYLKIFLTDTAPVRIETAQWPLIASAEVYEDPIFDDYREYYCLRVRRHEDCRAIVYGEHWVLDKGKSFRAGKGGKLLKTPRSLEEQTAEIAKIIHELGEDLRFPEHLIQECIDALPAVDLY